MEKRTISIIGIIFTTLFCGIPGLVGLCLGGFAILGANLPDSGFGTDEMKIATGVGAILIFLGLIFVAIPIVTTILTWVKKDPNKKPVDVVIPDEDF